MACMSINSGLARALAETTYQPESLPGGIAPGVAIMTTPGGTMATAGTFDITVNGVALTNVPYNVTARQLRTLLIAANGIFTAKNLAATSFATLPWGAINLHFFGNMLHTAAVVTISNTNLTGGTYVSGPIQVPGASYNPWNGKYYGDADVWVPGATGDVTVGSATVRMNSAWTLRNSGSSLEILASANNVNAQATRNTGRARPWRQMLGLAVRNRHYTAQNKTVMASSGTATGAPDAQITFQVAQGPGILWLNGTNQTGTTLTWDATWQTVLLRENPYTESGNNFYNQLGVSIGDWDGIITTHRDLPMVLLTADDGDETLIAMQEHAEEVAPHLAKKISHFLTRVFIGQGGKMSEQTARSFFADKKLKVGNHSTDHLPFLTAVDPAATGNSDVHIIQWVSGQPGGNLVLDFGTFGTITIPPATANAIVETIQADLLGSSLPIKAVHTNYTAAGALATGIGLRIEFHQAVPLASASVSAGNLNQWTYGRGFSEAALRRQISVNRQYLEQTLGVDYCHIYATPNGSHGEAYHNALAAEGVEISFLADRVNGENCIHHPMCSGPLRYAIPRYSLSTDGEAAAQRFVEKVMDAAMNGMSLAGVLHTYGGTTTSGLNISVADFQTIMEFLLHGHNRFFRVVDIEEFSEHLRQGNGGSLGRFTFMGQRVA